MGGNGAARQVHLAIGVGSSRKPPLGVVRRWPTGLFFSRKCASGPSIWELQLDPVVIRQDQTIWRDRVRSMKAALVGWSFVQGMTCRWGVMLAMAILALSLAP